MSSQKISKKVIVLTSVVVLATILSVSLFVAYYPRANHSGPQPQVVSGWDDEQLQCNETLSGRFVQVGSLGTDGFVLAGTSANGSVLLVHTRPSIEEGVWWQKTYGNGSGSAVVQTSDGGFLVAGIRASSGSNGTTNSSLLVLVDSQGNLVWSKEYAGVGFDSVVNASDGGYVMLGRFIVNGTEYPGLLKVDSAGNQLWCKTYSRSGADGFRLYKLISTDDGGYALAGYLQNNGSDVESQNGWFVKTNAQGEVLVNRPFALSGWAVFYGVAQTADGGYVLAGATANSTGGVREACIIRTDSDGHSLWSKTNAALEGRAVTYEYRGVAVAENGTLYVAGSLGGTDVAVEVMNATGTTDHYEIKEGIGGVCGFAEVAPKGYLVAAHKDSSVWLVEKFFFEVTVYPA